MKKKIRSFHAFTREIGKGIHIEWQETKEIPSLLLHRQYRKVGAQVADLCKMAGLGIVWIVPGGALITAFIVKFSYKARPSAFRPLEEEKAQKAPENEKQ